MGRLALILLTSSFIAITSGCGEADFGGDHGSKKKDPLLSELGKVGDNGGTQSADATVKGSVDANGNPVTPGGAETDGADGGDQGVNNTGNGTGDDANFDNCNRANGPGGSRLVYDGSRFEVHGTPRGDTISVRNPPSGKAGAILLTVNGDAEEVFCPGQLAIFGHEGDDSISLTPVAGLSSIAANGGN